MLVWMHGEPLEIEKPYLIKHTTQQGPATVTGLKYRVDINDLGKIPAPELRLNEIGLVSMESRRPIFFDAYTTNRTTGSFILIDPISNLTLAAGMIRERVREEKPRPVLGGVEFERSRLTPAERWDRAGHRPAAVWLTARLEVAYLLERELFDRGCLVHVLSDDVDSHLLPGLARMSAAAGLITICSVASYDPEELERARGVLGPDTLVEVDLQSLPANDREAADAIARLLEERGFIPGDERGLGGEGI
jgi:hypothetical protein